MKLNYNGNPKTYPPATPIEIEVVPEVDGTHVVFFLDAPELEENMDEYIDSEFQKVAQHFEAWGCPVMWG